MGGFVGRLFREFAVTLSVAIAVSLVVSLTTTPMMCAILLKTKSKDPERHGRMYRASEWVFDHVLGFYERTLGWVFRHQFLMILVTLATIGITVYLYYIVPKGLFPQQDTGRLIGSIIADQDTSSQAMERLLKDAARTVTDDAAVESTIASFGGNRGSTNTAMMYVALRPFEARKLSADQIRDRLQAELSKIPGASIAIQSVQDIRIGGRPTPSQYQFTLQGDDLKELYDWAPRVAEKIRSLKGIVGVISDQQMKGLQASLAVDRATAARFGITEQDIDNTLYDAFGQRQVSTMYTSLNQYHVVMEADPSFSQNPDGLKSIYVKGKNGVQVPLSAFTKYAPSTTPLAINHSGQFPSVTISFNLIPGVALSDAVTEIQAATHDMGLPSSIHGNFSGAAQAFEEAKANQLLLIASAIVAVYLVLGMLYESLIHPITILSTIPSAGVGALLALMLCHMELNVIGMIGIILLIGIVKKNAIMMIDFALEAERTQGKSPVDAIYQACVLRFRPITMTTMAALLGGLPLALGGGSGAELRKPLGITIVGGLIFSQMLTLYTTPVIYLYLDRFRLWSKRMFGSPEHSIESQPAHA